MTTPSSPSPAPRRRTTKGKAIEILPPLADADDWTCSPDDITLPPALEFEPVTLRGGRNMVTPMKQRVFIRVLAETGRVTLAAKAAGKMVGSFYHLRYHEQGASFAAAWARALDFGTARVLDVLLDHAINGVPEYIYKDGELVAERRRFNHQLMMWLVAHNMPEKFGVHGGLMHSGSSAAAGAARMKRLKAEWRAEWNAERQTTPRQLEEQRNSIIQKAKAMNRPRMIEIAQNPEKRAAYELINGPTDWTQYK